MAPESKSADDAAKKRQFTIMTTTLVTTLTAAALQVQGDTRGEKGSVRPGKRGQILRYPHESGGKRGPGEKGSDPFNFAEKGSDPEVSPRIRGTSVKPQVAHRGPLPPIRWRRPRTRTALPVDADSYRAPITGGRGTAANRRGACGSGKGSGKGVRSLYYTKAMKIA
jgi:hypothetical protein